MTLPSMNGSDWIRVGDTNLSWAFKTFKLHDPILHSTCNLTDIARIWHQIIVGSPGLSRLVDAQRNLYARSTMNNFQSSSILNKMNRDVGRTISCYFHGPSLVTWKQYDENPAYIRWHPFMTSIVSWTAPSRLFYTREDLLSVAPTFFWLQWI